MSKTNKERILDYLWSISPDWATNSQIRDATGIKSHQQVYLLTRRLMGAKLIRGEQRGREWIFWADESPAVQLASPRQAPMRDVLAQAEKRLSPRAFEDMARSVMSAHFGVPLASGQVVGVPKEFEYLLNNSGQCRSDLLSDQAAVSKTALFTTKYTDGLFQSADTKGKVVNRHKTWQKCTWLLFSSCPLWFKNRRRLAKPPYIRHLPRIIEMIRDHQLLDRSVVLPTLQALKDLELEPIEQPSAGPSFEELEAQCQSDLERQVLSAIRERGFPLPDKGQRTIYDDDQPVAIADFFYEPRIVVFVDGSPHYRDYVQQADRRKRKRLQGLGCRVVVVQAESPKIGLDDLAARLAR